jgi:hypothetical protein
MDGRRYGALKKEKVMAAMARWTGQTLTLAVGPRWTYKLELQEETESGARSHLVLGRGMFGTEGEARAAGDAHLKTELERRSS